MKGKIIWFSLIAVAVLAGGYAFFAQPAAPSSAKARQQAVKEFKINAYKYYFSPDIMTVEKGDKVKITINNADVLHGIRIPELGVDGNETIEFTADRSGEFIWYCNNYCGDGHRQMQGTLIIK